MKKTFILAILITAIAVLLNSCTPWVNNVFDYGFSTGTFVCERLDGTIKYNGYSYCYNTVFNEWYSLYSFGEEDYKTVGVGFDMYASACKVVVLNDSDFDDNLLIIRGTHRDGYFFREGFVLPTAEELKIDKIVLIKFGYNTWFRNIQSLEENDTYDFILNSSEANESKLSDIIDFTSCLEYNTLSTITDVEILFILSEYESIYCGSFGVYKNENGYYAKIGYEPKLYKINEIYNDLIDNS